ncbi:uncharacterized protein VTP21DRAFT_11531 [Calcarisporiella thermophila]|uniref:uncharacterized protein n=1 Tax=Calcarisporiella thermophila TaxID=911321 RepID=UPI003743CF0B
MQKLKRSYTYDAIMRINTLLECISDTRRSRDEVLIKTEEILARQNNGLRLKRELLENNSRVESLNREMECQKKLLDEKRREIKSLREKLKARRSCLDEARERYLQGKEYLDASQKSLERSRKTVQKTREMVKVRRRELIAEVSTIYPVETLPENPRLYQITGVRLPNSVFNGCDRELVATALGYTCHLVQMFAYYANIPLRYPMKPMSSRAEIMDPVSVIQGPRGFPLYLKGTDRHRFEYGVYLLNKNIEQLMNAYGLVVIDLRFTLPNLVSFLQNITTEHVSLGNHQDPLPLYTPPANSEDGLHSLAESQPQNKVGACSVREEDDASWGQTKAHIEEGREGERRGQKSIIISSG